MWSFGVAVDNRNGNMKETQNKQSGNCGFLDSVAQAYATEFPDSLADFCFVFPNKRAGTFFLRSLSRNLTRMSVAPQVLSIADFVESLSGRQVASRIDLLFRLYNLYRQSGLHGACHGDSGKSRTSGITDLLDFDSFRRWGEIVLSDFSAVDQYYVNPDDIFKNVADFRNISSNYLTSEQLYIMERYFGYTPAVNDIREFWRNFQTGGETDLKHEYLMLWQVMGPLYRMLDKSLAADGLVTPGGAYRLAVDRVREEGDRLFPYKKIVFVGFNALSTSEAMLFEAISKVAGVSQTERDAFADFYWDATGPVLTSRESDAAWFLRRNKTNLPSPSWAQPYLDKSDVSEMPSDIRVIASPSNAQQTKLAADRVTEIKQTAGEKSLNDARVAVVLPDENLLLPLLYALPSDIDSLNLTMGYSLRQTPVASFMHHLRRLHARSRMDDKDVAFFHEDIIAMISHPIFHLLLTEADAVNINTDIVRSHRVMIPLKQILDVASVESREALKMVLTAPASGRTDDGVAYLLRVLTIMDTSLSASRGDMMKSRLDSSHLGVYRDALMRLEDAAREHDIEMGLQGVFYMTDKLLAGEKVMFEGKPLAGLQVMGLLETRALDFDHLVILSLNDRVMPRKARRSSFIPDALRRGFGMPYANYEERLFSYYFYRMISRTKSVTLIYDARAGEGMRSGGESRYLMQLRYLYGRDKIRYDNYNFHITGAPHLNEESRAVRKEPWIMDKIEEFARKSGGRNLSATALRKYCECQVKFFYEVVAGLRTDTEEPDCIDPIAQGNIIHDTMLRLYFPEETRRHFIENEEDRVHMTSEKIDAILADRDLIRSAIEASIRLHHLHTRDQNAEIDYASRMVAGQLEKQIHEILEYDRQLTPFDLAGGEMEGLYRWTFRDARGKERHVNMKYAVDRLDILKPGTAGERWRIVDYKTGGALVKAEKRENIFDGTYDAKNIFQLLLYADLFRFDHNCDKDLKLSIYQVSRLLSEGEKLPDIEGTERDCDQEFNNALDEYFHDRLNDMLRDIFNPEIPFLPVPEADEESHCRFCRLQTLCGKL